MADIELVIKLNEDTYNTFKNLNQIIGVLSFEKDTLALIKAVKNSVPLPKFKCVYDKSSDCDHKNCDSCQYMCIAKYELETEREKA